MSKPQSEEMSAEKAPENPAAVPADTPLTAGARLLKAREDKAMNLRDVASKTRQSQETLLALETMKTDHIPNTILRLQAKNYARFLGLPEEEIASEYVKPDAGVATFSPPAPVSEKTRLSRGWVLGGGAALAVAAVAGVFGWIVNQPKPEPAGSLAISARLAPVHGGAPEATALAASSEDEFSIYAIKRAWIEVRASDGTIFRNREMSPGEAYYPRTGAGWTITVLDGGAFEWRLGDVSIEPVGQIDEALYSISVDDALSTAVTARNAALAEATVGQGQPR